MLQDKQPIATVAVKDLDVAREFYEGVLGLEVVDEQGSEALTLRSGGGTMIVYRSQYAGTNNATSVKWFVGREIETIVQGLKQRGVTFEHYDLPGLTQKGDVHAFGDFKTAWFKDPDGNIHSLMSSG